MIPNAMMMLIEKLASDGRISAEEAVDVRRAVFPDGAVTREEAEALFVLNERVGDDDRAWNDCFVEAIHDHLLFGAEPLGHVTDEGAAWLENRIGRDGVVERVTELELLIKILEKAESTPARLQELARIFVSRAVLSGEGYEGRDVSLVPGQIGDVELAMIRRVLFAAAGAGNIAVTRDEAEWLFSLDTATEGRAHVSGWRELFVSAIMNHLFAAGPSALLERGSMLRRAEWLRAEQRGGVGSFLSRAMEGVQRGDHKLKKSDLEVQKHIVDGRQVEMRVAEALDMAETAWLVTRIRADGRRTANEQALMEAVKSVKGADSLKSA